MNSHSLSVKLLEYGISVYFNLALEIPNEFYILTNGEIGMNRPYSYDLRQKVIEAIEQNGMKKSEASQIFNLSRNTIDLWLKRRTETGDFRAKQARPPGNGHKITDWEKFRAFVKRYGDKTQAEMAQLWDTEISQRTISRALQKIGFTRKKRLTATANGTKPSEQHS